MEICTLISKHMRSPALVALTVLLLAVLSAPAQDASPQQVLQPPKDAVTSAYILGPGDDVVVKAVDVDEIKETPVRIDMQGNIKLPLVGKVHAAGLKAEELEALLNQQLKLYVIEPQVIVSVTTFRSQPVMILGAVTQPGVHQLEGRKTLFEVISSVGGLRSDAGYTIKITRQKEWGRIPLPGCTEDATGQYYVAEVDVKSVMEAKNPGDNIVIQPRDIITVPKVQVVYVVGAVKKPGGFALGDAPSMTVLQALALAEGLDRFASADNARVMRMNPGGIGRTDIRVDVKKIFKGQANDVALGPEDILFVPTSGAKQTTARTLEAAIAVGSGIAIYGVR